LNDQELKLIDGLFGQLRKAAAEGGPPDPEAAQRINEQLRAFPQAPYYMAQLVILQRAALKRAQELAKTQSPPTTATGAPVGNPAQPTSQQGGGFLAGAAQTALGVAGGIVVADLAIGAIDELAYGDVADEMALEGAYEAGAGDMASASALGGDDFGGDDFGGGDWGGGDDFGGGDFDF
jgi:hypothetical protein